MKRIVEKLRNDSLVNSSFYLIAASSVTALLGFVFWVISARIFSSEQVGLAATLIAAMALINTLTLFGFDFGIIRFWKSANKRRLVSSCILISVAACLIASIAFVLLFWKTKVGLETHVAYPLLFILLSSGWVLFNLVDSVYIAMKRSKLVLLKQSLFSILKLILPFLLVSLGFFAIYSSWAAASLIALLALVIYQPFPFSFSIDLSLIRKLFSFSTYNYLSNLFMRVRELLLPLIVTYMLGARHTAYFYLAFNVTLVFLLVPKAISKALLAELSHKKKALRSNLRKSMLLTLISAAGVIVFIFLLGRYVLLLYGTEYAQNSLRLLYIFSIAGVFASLNEVYFALMRVEFKLKQLLAAQVINATLTISLSMLLIAHALTGIGIAWLMSELIVSVFVIIVYRKLNPLKVLL